MKRYDVLEAHLGDKQYTPGDPVSGTRIADPNVVQHLVGLRILREAGDQTGIYEPAPPADPLADLRAQVGEASGQIDTLNSQLAIATGERDIAREEAGRLAEDLAAARKEVEGLGTDLVTAIGERNAAREEAETLRAAAQPDEGQQEGDDDPDPPARVPRGRKAN